MSTVKIGNRTATFVANQGDTTYLLAEGKSIDMSGFGYGIDGTGSASGRAYVVNGHIDAGVSGVRIGAIGAPVPQATITVGATGRIDATGYGIEVHGTGHEVANHGRIFASVGIQGSGNAEIVNTGRITATNTGIGTHGDNDVVNKGTISATTGVYLDGADGTVNHLRNSGTIQGSERAISGGFGAETVVNTGTIKGDVYLYRGEDTFIFKAGEITGTVSGGEGSDHYVIGKAGANLVEAAGEGLDMVNASVSMTLPENFEQLFLTGGRNINGKGNEGDNHLQGNAGNNVLRGEGGKDFLFGMGGTDRLWGGGDEDVFNFQKGTGKDIVMDFAPGIDELQVGGLKGATGFEDMMANHVSQHGDDLWISYGKDVVVLKGIDANDLQMQDFVFG